MSWYTDCVYVSLGLIVTATTAEANATIGAHMCCACVCVCGWVGVIVTAATDAVRHGALFVSLSWQSPPPPSNARALCVCVYVVYTADTSRFTTHYVTVLFTIHIYT